MALSVFDLFSIGIGPSSSHTVGPMRAAKQFVDATFDTLKQSNTTQKIARIQCTLYGSLGSTGKGHSTDTAVILGLLGEAPETVNPRITNATVAQVISNQTLPLSKDYAIPFNLEEDIIFRGEVELPAHPNGMCLTALDATDAVIYENYYYSIGGGFVVCGEADMEAPLGCDETPTPYPFHTAADLLNICADTGLSIAEVMWENELVWRNETEIRQGLLDIWQVMNECIENGIATTGILPGSLRVPRRAPGLAAKLRADNSQKQADPLAGIDWITLYALAVNEENAAGGRVVTAPTNGAAGIIPAVLRYYQDFIAPQCEKKMDEAVVEFLLTAGAIGIIFKNTASISGAEVGCQGEVGSACSMAAGGMAAILGGTALQVENAAEIGMEHNLGLTCDPVAGLVQIPCIERNAVASVKAVTAARTAMRGDGSHIVSLDSVIKTMRDTGYDMQSKYKETSLGGLAVNVTIC